MTPPPSFFEKPVSGETWIKRMLVLAMAVPALICVLLVAGIATALAAAPSPADSIDCKGTNLVDVLKAEGRYAAVQSQAEETVNGEGKFWKIEKDGIAPSYLYGTMHLSDPRVVSLPASAETAFEAARLLVIETTDILDGQKAAAALMADPALTTLPAGKSLGDYLTPAQKADVSAALGERGIPFGAVKTLKPYLTAMSLMMPDCEIERQKGGATVLDVDLAKRAQAADKPVEGLETANDQVKALLSLPIDEQVDSLVLTLKYGDRIPDMFETMIDLYVDGKIATIMPAIEAALPDAGILVGEGEGAAAFEKTIITDRNQRMAKGLQPILSGGNVFVAVGALHLPGEDGLVSRLRQAGWTVTKMQ